MMEKTVLGLVYVGYTNGYRTADDLSYRLL